jgi:GTP-binding protein
MLPTLVLVGRPNVGKSTLFNRLTRSRDAIVADMPGLTRDRHYGRARLGERPCLVVDTGGFEPAAKTGIMHQMARQTLQAVDEADVIWFVVDAREGVTAQDRVIAEQLRRTGRPLWLTVNKAEGMNRGVVTAEFHELGIGEPYAISAAHGEGVRELLELALEQFDQAAPEAAAPQIQDTPRIAIVGRPNVGKSTLVNAILGEERMIAFDQPGTTRDAIEVEFERNGKPYVLIDTAGLRRRGKVFESVEKFSVVKTLQAIENANVAILVLDATQEITDQDAHIAGFILEAGRALVVAINKWDAPDAYTKERVKHDFARKLNFLGFARMRYISALNVKGVDEVLADVDAAFAAAMAKLSTPRLTRALIAAVERQQPPRSGMTRPKLRYAHQGGTNPPTIIIHGTSLHAISDSYRRYLESTFRDVFKLAGTPLRIQFKVGRNPYSNTESKR